MVSFFKIVELLAMKIVARNFNNAKIKTHENTLFLSLAYVKRALPVALTNFTAVAKSDNKSI